LETRSRDEWDNVQMNFAREGNTCSNFGINPKWSSYRENKGGMIYGCSFTCLIFMIQRQSCADIGLLVTLLICKI
jgi:hypothetical protein